MTSTIPEYAGCPWPVDPACLGDAWDAYAPEVQDRAVALASATLTRLTAFRVGNCPVTIRPVAQGCRGASPWGGWLGPFTPQNFGGVWTNGGCSPSQCEVELPAPVGRVDEVKVDGAVIAPADYRVDVNAGRYLLVWQGTGECPWNLQQNLSLPDSAPDTFSVTFLNAHPVDGLGAYAVGLLAVEYAKACTDAGKCRLPKGVTSIVRDGVSIDIASGAFPGGLTGIREVDAYIALWNPAGRQRQSSVYSPDLPTYRVQGG